MSTKDSIKSYFDSTADRRLTWKNRNRFYHRSLEKYFSFIIPAGSRVLEVGCGTGDLLMAVKPSFGVGIDFSGKMTEIAKSRYPELHFRCFDIEEDSFIVDLDHANQTFDYIILSDLLHVLWDVQQVLHNLNRFCHPGTRIIISNYNFIWEPLLRLMEFLHLKQQSPNSNWLSHYDIFNLLELENFSVITNYRKILFPKYVPVFNFIFNRVLVNLPIINSLGLVNFIVARPKEVKRDDLKVSVIIPARNEKGNINNAIMRTPVFGKSQEFIFVEGHSSDGTWEEMKSLTGNYPDKKIISIQQTGKGKGNAVREGFDVATGEVLMILDADLTTSPEDLPKFYNALIEGKGELINGCRLVYPMEKEAMRSLNMLANKLFGWFFSYILGQRLKDTLCGTKVLLKSDYEKIRNNRPYFGDFDPFGDFDLLFGASKLNLKITDILVRYKERKYGSTQISRFKHGWLLLRMSMFAAGKIKFI